MKCLWKKVICGALVAGMLAQCPQSIYAEDAANTATVTDTESNHVTPDTTQQPDDTKQPGDTQQPDDTQQPGDIQQPDDIQQPEELPQPSAVEGLHTTKQGKTKVYLEWEESSDAAFAKISFICTLFNLLFTVSIISTFVFMALKFNSFLCRLFRAVGYSLQFRSAVRSDLVHDCKSGRFFLLLRAFRGRGYRLYSDLFFTSVF